MEARVIMSPMLAATSRASAPKRRWAAEVIQRLYDLGANFKAPLLDVRCMHKRITNDPLYQLIKHQVRDVTQRDIEEFRRKADALQKGQSIAALKVEEEAQSDGSKTSATASPRDSNVSNSSESR